MTSRLAIALSVVLVVACQGVTLPEQPSSLASRAQTTATFASRQSPEATSLATPPSSAGASPTPAGADATPLPAPVAALRPGRYLKTGFEPALSFEIGDGWTAAQATTGFFDIQDEPGSLDVVAVQFARTGAAFADLLAQAIAKRDNLSVSEPETVSIDGFEGLRLTIETTDPIDTNLPIFRPVLDIDAGPLSIASGRRLQVTLLDVPELGTIGPSNTVLAILVGGSIAEWDRTLEVATPVVESIEFD